MTKKEYFKLFFSNSGWGFYGWCIFNLIFGITYLATSEYSRELTFQFPRNEPALYECLIPYAVIYIVALVPTFLMGFFWVKKTGNVISDFISLLPIRFLTVVSSLWIAGYHYSYKFANFSVVTFDTMLNMVDRYGYSETDPILYYLMSIIPFVVTFIGFQIGKKRRKNKQEETKE